MWDKFVVELSQATQEFLRGVAQFLPRLLVTLFIVVIGGLAAWVIEVIVRSILRLIKFDRFSFHSGGSKRFEYCRPRTAYFEALWLLAEIGRGGLLDVLWAAGGKLFFPGGP